MIWMRKLPPARKPWLGWLAVLGEVLLLALASIALLMGPWGADGVTGKGLFILVVVAIGALGIVAEVNLTRRDSLRLAFWYIAFFIVGLVVTGLLYAIARTFALASLSSLFDGQEANALLVVGAWVVLMRSVARHLPLWSLVALGLPLLFVGIQPAGGFILVITYAGYLWYLRHAIRRQGQQPQQPPSLSLP